MNVSERFFEKVEPRDGCLVFVGALSSEGYGRFHFEGKLHQAHRWILERWFGEPLDPTLDVDHLCRNRACVRPSHLELVSRSENIRRGDIPRLNRERADARTHCANGHEWTPETTYLYKGARHCKACKSERMARAPRETINAYSRAYRARQRAKRAAA